MHKVARIAVLVLIALACWRGAGQFSSERQSIWIEAESIPRTICSQGAPATELVNLRLWPGGPGFRVKQEKKIGTGIGAGDGGPE